MEDQLMKIVGGFVFQIAKLQSQNEELLKSIEELKRIVIEKESTIQMFNLDEENRVKKVS